MTNSDSITIDSFLRTLSELETRIQSCGRACPDMGPDTRPDVPAVAPLSLLELLRANPDMKFAKEWLAIMDASATIH